MNIAEKCIEYYESEDFAEPYIFALFESFREDEQYAKNRIYESAEHDYKFHKLYGANIRLNNVELNEVYNWLYDEIFYNGNSPFINKFVNYYVGGGELSSIQIGEVEEQLTGIYNHNTGKEYNLQYLKRVFESAGYHVSGDYAYYYLDGTGYQVNLYSGGRIPVIQDIVKQAAINSPDRLILWDTGNMSKKKVISRIIKLNS